MNCQQCGAPMRVDRERALFVCDYCGSEAVPPASDDGVLVLGESKQKCPVCAKSLSTGSLEQYDLLYCTECHGMLISMDDFQPLISTLREEQAAPAAFLAPRSEADARRTLHCPKCGKEMDDHPYGGGGNVNVDTCEACESIWLDRGELRKIASAADHPAYT